MIGTSCRYAPDEIIAGLGQEAVRLDPHPVSFSCAESCSHPNLCSFCKAVIEEVHARHLEEIVLTDCCDASRRMYDVLKNMDGVKFCWLLSLPHKNGRTDIRLFAAALEDFVHAYEAYKHISFDTDKAIAAYEAKRGMPAEPEGPYLRLAGAHGGSLLKKQMEETFPGYAISDETCTGTRILVDETGTKENFYEWYASALLNQPSACMRMWHMDPPAPLFAKKPAGTVYHTIKFCDYYGFGYMEEKQNSRILKIETDTTPQSGGQLKTRLEAFREELTLTETKHMIRTSGKIYAAGLDSGSTSTDAVVMDGEGKILGSAIVPTGAGVKDGAAQAMRTALAEAGLREEDLAAVTTTGYGRSSIGIGGRAVTEITCHARGAHYLDPQARTVIDIGGQDSKVIRIDEDGRVENFVMNDKCAAGTGRFLEMQARALGISLDDMSRLGLKWKKPVEISSMCTVFAESEVVSLVAENTAVPDIIHGLNESVAAKTASLVARVGGKEGYMMSGGVARNEGVRQCLEEKLGAKVSVSEYAQLCGAIGAALLALESIRS
jgi:predicted CoA-substrate-specific enzyme activase